MEETAALLASPRIKRRMQSTRASTASLASVNARGEQQQIIDVFLQEVKAMGDRTPTGEEIAVARDYLQLLTSETLRDYLRSTDELLAQVPTEFTQKLRSVEDAEAFIFACASGELEPVRRMLDTSWDLIHAIDRDGHTALHAAAAMNHADLCSFLLDRGAKVNTQDFEGYTPLHWAVESAALPVVQVLASAGADVFIRTNEGLSPVDFVENLKPKHKPAIRKCLADREADMLQARAAAGGSTAAIASGGASPGAGR